jgi:hypothetical protein
MPEPVRFLHLQSLSIEILQMVVDLTIYDTKNLLNVRAVSKLLRALSNQNFRQCFLTHLHVAQTPEAFTRLAGTTQVPELASDIQSITVTYDNQNPSVSAALCLGMETIDKVDLLLRALDNLHHMGKRICLTIRVAETPLDNKASVISITYQVLVYILFCHGGHGVRKLFLDFDDTTPDFYAVVHTLSKTRASTKDYGPGFRRIWAYMMHIETLEEVRVRFSKEREETDAPRYLAIARRKEGIYVTMQGLSTWHFDIMGRMKIFSNIYSLDIRHCDLMFRDRDHLFNNPNLRDLHLLNVSLSYVERLYNPASVIECAKDWDLTMKFIAANTCLQCFYGRGLMNIGGQIPLSWIFKARPGRLVSQQILTDDWV